MIKNSKKDKSLGVFVFEYRGIMYNIDIQKLNDALKILNIDIKKDDLILTDNFKNLLKTNNLLVEEFLEYISKS